MIKQVDEIPESISMKRKSYRQKIRDDIQEAVDSGIGKFEFVGDYNFKYLHMYAREEADVVFGKRFRQFVRFHANEWKEKYGLKYIYLSDSEFRHYSNIEIVSVKQPNGERRVFCKITSEEEMEKKLLDACERKLANEQKEEQRTLNRKKLILEDYSDANDLAAML